jgi:hypothetical protein
MVARKARKDLMPRFILGLVSCGVALLGATATAPSANADSAELSRCLDASTMLQAGGDVGDKELTAAQSACARLKQSSKDSKTLARVDAATATIAEEMHRRQASRH